MNRHTTFCVSYALVMDTPVTVRPQQKMDLLVTMSPLLRRGMRNYHNPTKTYYKWKHLQVRNPSKRSVHHPTQAKPPPRNDTPAVAPHGFSHLGPPTPLPPLPYNRTGSTRPFCCAVFISCLPPIECRYFHGQLLLFGELLHLGGYHLEHHGCLLLCAVVLRVVKPWCSRAWHALCGCTDITA